MRKDDRLRLLYQPDCAVCGNASATIELLKDGQKTRLIYKGPGGSNGNIGDIVSDKRADAISRAFMPPYVIAKIKAAGFYDDAGYCTRCKCFYCPAHWNISGTGGGKCPKGHFKSLDPHWSPDMNGS